MMAAIAERIAIARRGDGHGWLSYLLMGILAIILVAELAGAFG
jgi:hypothetical protein